MHGLCCSMGLQWPNPHNKESPQFTHCLLEKMENLPTARARYPPAYPFVFLFWGYPGPQSCGDLPPPPSCEGRKGGVYWSRFAANRLYHYCSLSDCCIQKENNGGDDPQSSPSGLTDWKWLDCLMIGSIFSWEASGWCVDSPVTPVCCSLPIVPSRSVYTSYLAVMVQWPSVPALIMSHFMMSPAWGHRCHCDNSAGEANRTAANQALIALWPPTTHWSMRLINVLSSDGKALLRITCKSFCVDAALWFGAPLTCLLSHLSSLCRSAEINAVVPTLNSARFAFT